MATRTEPTPPGSAPPKRIARMVLVGSQYDSYILTEAGFRPPTGESSALSMYGLPECISVSTGKEAIELVAGGKIDLVLTDLRAGDMSAFDLGRCLSADYPDVPLILLTGDPKYAKPLRYIPERSHVERIFFWRGDIDLLNAIVLLSEDKMNLVNDMKSYCRVILVVEDEPSFYSYYLPVLYKLLLHKTWRILSSVKRTDASDRRSLSRARVVLADTFDDAQQMIENHLENLLGVITDLQYLRGNELDVEAGISLTKMVKAMDPNIPVLLQSGHSEIKERAEAAGATFLWKRSDLLMTNLKKFMINSLGFGDFIFRRENGEKVFSASTVDELIRGIKEVPIESLEFHASRNHFSTWLFVHGEPELASLLNPIHEKGETLRELVVSILTSHRKS